MPTTRRQPIKTEAALAALHVLSAAGRLKRPALQDQMGAKLGRIVEDTEFETAMTALGRRIIRVRGGGRPGGIWLA